MIYIYIHMIYIYIHMIYIYIHMIYIYDICTFCSFPLHGRKSSRTSSRVQSPPPTSNQQGSTCYPPFTPIRSQHPFSLDPLKLYLSTFEYVWCFPASFTHLGGLNCHKLGLVKVHVFHITSSIEDIWGYFISNRCGRIRDGYQNHQKGTITKLGSHQKLVGDCKCSQSLAYNSCITNIMAYNSCINGLSHYVPITVGIHRNLKSPATVHDLFLLLALDRCLDRLKNEEFRASSRAFCTHGSLPSQNSQQKWEDPRLLWLSNPKAIVVLKNWKWTKPRMSVQFLDTPI